MHFSQTSSGFDNAISQDLEKFTDAFFLNGIIASGMPWHVPSIYMESFHHGPSVVGLPQVLFGIYSHSQWTYK